MTSDTTGTVTDKAVHGLRGTTDPHPRELLAALIRHLHGVQRPAVSPHPHRRTDDPSSVREFGVPNPFRHARFLLVLEPS